MRGKKKVFDLIDIMKQKDDKKLFDSKWAPYIEDDFEKIKECLTGKDSALYYLGVREDYMNLYYMGMSMASIHTYYNRCCRYKMSYYYSEGITDGSISYEKSKEENSAQIPSAVFWKKTNFEIVKHQIEKHVLGYHDGKLRLEKICQQWIMNENNNNPESDWYFIDMEYIYKGENEKGNHPFGRADLIAISKTAHRGVHQVAFIELKVGIKAYDGKKDSTKLMKALSENLYDKQTEKIKLGSGLASHIVDFMHFFSHDFYENQVRQEILNALRVHEKFGLLENAPELKKLNDVKQICEKPSIQIVTYSKIPNFDMGRIKFEEQQKYPNCDLKSMKSSFFNHMYDSDMSVVGIISNKDIDELVKLEEKFKSFVNNSLPEISCEQTIGEKGKYTFVFRFIDVDAYKGKSFECIV